MTRERQQEVYQNIAEISADEAGRIGAPTLRSPKGRASRAIRRGSGRIGYALSFRF